MKRFLALFTVVLVVLSQMVLGVSCQKRPAPFVMPSAPPPIEALTYTNSEYGFALDYPTDWEVIEGWRQKYVVTFWGPVVLEGTDYDFHVNIKVWIEQLPKDMTLQDYVMVNMSAGAQQATGTSHSEFYGVTISGVPATIIVQTLTIKIGQEKIPWESNMGVFIEDNVGYVIVYDVPAEHHGEYLDAFNLAITTFKFE